MKWIVLTTVLFYFGVSIVSAAKVKKCLLHLPTGVEVDDSTNKVVFPPATRDPSSKSQILTEYDTKGLDPFFNLAKSFMNTVQRKNFPEMKDASGDLAYEEELKQLQKRSGKLYDYEVPIAACCIIGILFAILMPCVGWCFCMCRCCGKCGGDMTQDDKAANSHCKCFIFAVILLLVAVFMLAGVAMMFVTNANLKSEIGGTTKTYSNAVSEAWRYLGNVKKELKEITVNKTNCLYEDLIVKDISDTGAKNLVGIPLQNMLKPHILVPLDSLVSASDNVTAMKNSLDIVSNTSSELKSSATELENQLKKVKTDLDNIKSDCSSSGIPGGCAEIQTDGLKQAANFSNLPSVDSELTNVRDIINQNFSGAVDEAKKVFADIPDTVVSKASSTLTSVRKLAKDGKEKIVNSTTDIYDKLDNIIKDRSKYENYNSDMKTYLDKDKFRYYGFAGLAGIMALIVALLTIGLFCGICGYDRDKTPTNRSSASHHGGNMIMSSVGFMFIFAFFFFLITSLAFFVGEHLHIMCRELKDGKVIDTYGGKYLRYNGTQISAVNLIRNCRDGQSIYRAANGKSVFNLNDKLNFSKLVNIDDTLNNLKVNLSDQSVLNADTEKSLMDLKNSSVDKINFTSFFNEIRKNVVQVNLTLLASNLTELANNVSGLSNPNASRIANNLRYVAGNLTQMNNVTIRKIKNNTNLLETNLKDVKVKANDLETVAQNILDQLRTADNYIKTSANNDVKTIIKNYVNRVIGWPDQFIQHVLKELDNNVANCKPIANIYDGLVNVYLCTGIIGNFNGFWFSMGWCLFFFLFAIIFGVKLAKFLRRMRCKAEFDPYPGYEMQQRPVKLPMNDAVRSEKGIPNQSYAGHGGRNAAPPPYVG